MNTWRNESAAFLPVRAAVVLMFVGVATVPYGAVAQTWQFTATGSLNTSRYSHTATQLPDGRVLIAGGRSDYSASAELYDPVTGTFTATGSMNTTRNGHTATLIPNGKVLMVGGTGYAPGSTELYDPATGAFTATGSLTPARHGHTATLLPNGKVFIAGGRYYDGNKWTTMASSALYDPATGTFTATGSMGEARESHTATLLTNGKVLITGGLHWAGQPGTWTMASAEVYDPATGMFMATGSMNALRNSHTATLLPNGTVLVIGGNQLDGANGPATATAELYDTAAGTFTATGSMGAQRHSHAATLLPIGKVLIAGGIASDSWGYPSRSAELYDPATGTFTAAASMIDYRARFTATLLSASGRLLIAAGVTDSATLLSRAELYGNPQCQ